MERNRTGASEQRAMSGREVATSDARTTYEPPMLLKKRSVARVTLFSGAGAAGTSGLTSA